MTTNTAAERLKLARLQAGFREAKEACEKLGFSYPAYKAHEAGDRGLRPAVAEQYAKAFGVAVQWLQYGTGSAQPLGASPLIKQVLVLLQDMSEADQRRVLGYVEGIAMHR